jgi:hypothetical protein
MAMPLKMKGFMMIIKAGEFWLAEIQYTNLPSKIWLDPSLPYNPEGKIETGLFLTSKICQKPKLRND